MNDIYSKFKGMAVEFMHSTRHPGIRLADCAFHDKEAFTLAVDHDLPNLIREVEEAEKRRARKERKFLANL